MECLYHNVNRELIDYEFYPSNITNAENNLKAYISDFDDLNDETKNMLIFSVCLQQQGCTKTQENAILEDPDECNYLRWHSKQIRVNNYINMWNYINKEFDDNTDVKNKLLNSNLFFNPNLLGYLNHMCFSRKFNMTDINGLHYFDKIFDYSFAVTYNPTYKDYLESQNINTNTNTNTTTVDVDDDTI